jgi:hypothetical protein
MRQLRGLVCRREVFFLVGSVSSPLSSYLIFSSKADQRREMDVYPEGTYFLEERGRRVECVAVNVEQFVEHPLRNIWFRLSFVNCCEDWRQ